MESLSDDFIADDNLRWWYGSPLLHVCVWTASRARLVKAQAQHVHGFSRQDTALSVIAPSPEYKGRVKHLIIIGMKLLKKSKQEEKKSETPSQPPLRIGEGGYGPKLRLLEQGNIPLLVQNIVAGGTTRRFSNQSRGRENHQFGGET